MVVAGVERRVKRGWKFGGGEGEVGWGWLVVVGSSWLVVVEGSVVEGLGRGEGRRVGAVGGGVDDMVGLRRFGWWVLHCWFGWVEWSEGVGGGIYKVCAVGVFVVDGHEMLRVVSVSSGFEVPDLPTPPCAILGIRKWKQRQMLCYQSKNPFSDAAIRPESHIYSPLCFHSNSAERSAAIRVGGGEKPYFVCTLGTVLSMNLAGSR